MLILCSIPAFTLLQKAEAIITSDTLTFLSPIDDGYIHYSSTNYTTARNSTVGNIVSNETNIVGGQKKVGSVYTIMRSFLFFDTSALEGKTITSAKLSLDFCNDFSAQDFNITVQNGQPTYPHQPLAIGDYSRSWYSGDGGQWNSSLYGAGYQNITFNSNGISWIQKTGTTKLCLRSSRDINGNVPTTTEYLIFYARDKGEAYAPKLYVTFTGSYNYLIHGPYYENGYLANVIVSVSLSFDDKPSISFTLNGTGGVADFENVTSAYSGVALTWNITNPASNKTRTYYIQDSSFEEIYVFLPNQNEPYYLYTFTVTDFAGVTNGFIETVITVNGTNRAVERYSLDVINQIPFWMTWSHKYNLRLIADEGTYNYGVFIALNIQDQSIVITTDMFPEAMPGQLISVNASRVNATWIKTIYVDTENLTLWVHVNIKTRSSFGWTSVYTANNTGQTQTVNWYAAEATLDYLVVVTALRSSQMTWSFSCPKVTTVTNPWTGILEILGDLPFPVVQLIGFLIVLAFGAIFSYAHIGVGCVVMVIIGGFLTYIGWLQLSVTAIAFAMTVSVMVVLHESKKREREV